MSRKVQGREPFSSFVAPQHDSLLQSLVMNIVLSHITAVSLHRAPNRSQSSERLPGRRGHIAAKAPSSQELPELISLLEKFGVSMSDDARIHVAVSHDHLRRYDFPDTVAYHVVSYEIPARSYLVIGTLSTGTKVLVPDCALCFLQYASVASFFELVEFGYELCGTYEPSFDSHEEYRTRPAKASVASLGRSLQSFSRVQGLAKARRALLYIRDGSASAMETALAMLVTLPRKLGGLGIKSVSLNERVVLQGKAKRLAKRKSFVLDLHIEHAHIDIEYNGKDHDTEEQRKLDIERANALNAMGFVVYTATSATFAHQLDAARFLHAIAQRARVRGDIVSPEYQDRQNELRLFVIRHWIHGDK